MPADWMTTEDVAAWIGPMTDPVRLADSTAAAMRFVEDRRSELDLAGSADPPPADVKLGAIIYASLVSPRLRPPVTAPTVTVSLMCRGTHRRLTCAPCA
jgi:hypothetical protein